MFFVVEKLNYDLLHLCPGADVRTHLVDGPPEQTGKNRPVRHVDLGSVSRPRPSRLQQRLPGRRLASAVVLLLVVRLVSRSR